MAGYPGFFRTGALIAAASLGLMASAAIAQDTTPVAELQEAAGEPAHPAHIHSGTCDNLGDVVWPLADVGVPASVEGTPVPAAGEVGSQAAIPAFVSVTRLDVSMEDI
ncbi:MAG: hypothetical protein IT337_17675, partial [Thermomicrobiales bacterium]|nr:hypothetical protein [Thermomicrobiales bacterium]